MRTDQLKQNGVTLKAYAGTTGVMLAMDVEPEKRQGLLGFAIQRVQVSKDRANWLEGGLNFPGVEHEAGHNVPTNKAPIQKFRWADYAVYPDKEYRYTVHPVYGTPAKPQLEDGPTADVRTESPSRGEHGVVFNRAAAASQAFSRRFADFLTAYDEAGKHKEPRPEMPPAAYAWLTRGLLDQILNFIERAADLNWALDVAMYQYELPVIVRAIEAARARGANIRVVYHAKPNDKQTEINESNLAGLPALAKRGRITHKIMHHKFMVLSRVSGGVYQPRAVLCGSTNFTENGVYRQANVVHTVEDADLAGQYLNLFNVLFRGDDVKATRNYINETNPIAESGPLYAGFSPRSKLVDLTEFIKIVKNAERDVLFCTAFNLYNPLQQALLGKPQDDVLRYGLQNTRSKITGIHADRTADFAAAAMLKEGLEGWLRETTAGQKGNILIHTKLIVVDFTSDSPIVISGSHNYSKPASDGNDENFLILRDVPGVSDTYGCEMMRLYDHYRFRYHLEKGTRSGKPKQPLMLTPDNSWTVPYFGGNAMKTLDRTRFVGE